MNRNDDWRRGRDWRGSDRERQGGEREWRGDERGNRDLRGSFYPGNHGFEENESSGRTPAGDDGQPYSDNMYGRYPGQQQRGGRNEWRSQSEQRPAQRYGQREPYNSPSYRGSRYSESQYGTRGGRGQNFESRFDQGSDFDRGSRFDRGSTFDQGAFADTHDSPHFFGTGNYGDGGASYTGGYDERQGFRNYGSLYGNEGRYGESRYGNEQRGDQRYQFDRYDGPEPRRYRTGPKGYTRSDERLREEISERLMMADSIDSSDVTVTVKDAKVTLEGTVPDRRMKHSIEDLADRCPGVQDVDNRIRVQREDYQRKEWGSSTTASSASSTMSASGATPTSTSGSSGTTFGGRGRKE